MVERDGGDPIDPGRDGWPAPEPRPEFADQVMSGLRAQGAFRDTGDGRPSRRRSVVGLVGAFVAGVAVAAAVALFVSRGRTGGDDSIDRGASDAPEVARVAVERTGAGASLSVRAGEVLFESGDGDVQRVVAGQTVTVAATAGEGAARGDTRPAGDRPSVALPDTATGSGACYCPDDARPLEADQALLEDWAAACRVRVDIPPLVEPTAEDLAQLDAIAGELGLVGDERDRFRDAALAVTAAEIVELQRIYVDATGDEDAEAVDPGMLITLIDRTSGPGEPALVRQRLSRERAGLDEPPADMSKVSPFEELYRRLVGLGDAFERELARVVGSERARALRVIHGGWPGPGLDWIGCPAR